MANKRIAFATCAQFPELAPGDQLAVQALAALDVEAVAAVWDEEGLDWSGFDAVLLRSTWDYFLKPRDFSAWIDLLVEQNIPLWNPPEILRWNMDKLYLSDLEEMGFPVTPSVWLPRGAKIKLSELLADKGWEEAVIKPAVSAGAHRTVRVSRAAVDGAQAQIDEMLLESGALVQPFMAEIQSEGEWSLMFLGKQYSHAVIKRPNAGDFRVQMQFGGSTEAIAPSPALIEQAQAIIDQVGDPLPYARVDGVEQGGQLILMELELIEPYLFLEEAKGAAERFAAVVKELL